VSDFSASGVACANIAFIKYWGNLDHLLRLPANGSISMNLGGLTTRTRVTFDPQLEADIFSLNGLRAGGQALQRVSTFLGRVRQMAGITLCARVDSENNFPTGAGIASSASAFAALSLAAAAAAGLNLDEPQLSRLARTGSGSACRSVPGGFVEWQMGNDETSYAYSIAPADYWELVDCIAVISREHKPTGSTEGHALADTSPLQAARLADAPRRLDLCRQAILERDFEALAQVVELDSNMMHAVMLTSTPPLVYWLPGTLAIMGAVQAWRREGLAACYTTDAGPNVHVLCLAHDAEEVTARLRRIPGVSTVLQATPGGAAQLLT
jgi:diphosphomevalonate decarboxylase